MHKIVIREFFSKVHNCTMYMASIDGGPQDLLSRGTKEAALADGASYAAKHWEQRKDGFWFAK